MDAPVTDQYDGLSDYGSDFIPDEEDLLNGLLQQVPDQGDNPNTDPDQQGKDVGDNEGPRGAKLPRRLGRDQDLGQNVSPQTPEKRKYTIEVDGDTSTNGMLRPILISSTD